MEILVEKNRVYIEDDEGKCIAYVTFPSVDEATVVIDHTFVDDSLRGMGVASKLMAKAIEEIQSQHKHAILECSYAKSYFEKNHITL